MGRKKAIQVDIEALSAQMKATEDKDEYRRLQCLWFRVTCPDMTIPEIGEATGFGPDRVDALFRAYRKCGDFSFAVDTRGGRRHQNLTWAEEDEFLNSFRERAATGSLVSTAEIKAAYEKRVGHKVPDSTITRMLKRQGWHKIEPYQRHPKGNPETQKNLKKPLPKKFQPH